MPIYAYKCASCGHAQDVLQKISDAPLSICPVCGADAFTKQVTAAGFQLKGSGWYVTDFKGSNSPAAAPAADAKAEPASNAGAVAGTGGADAPKKEATTASAVSDSSVPKTST